MRSTGLSFLVIAAALAFGPGRIAASELHHAAQNCDIPRLRQLIAAGAPLNEFDARLNTPLHDAVRAGKAPCVFLLLKAGANPYPPNRAGETGHLLARRFPETETSSRMVALFEHPNLVAPATNSIAYAALRGLDAVVSVLLEAGVDPNAADPDGRTPLHHAALKGRASLVQLLLEHGASVEARDSAGSRPLHDAALGGNVDSVRALLQHGADISATIRESGETPLHMAASWGKVDVVRALLEAGANKTARDRQGRTPFDLAVRNGQDEVARLLR
jgi:ankyrin repeat protein